MLPVAFSIAVLAGAGGIGAVCRLLLDGWVTSLTQRRQRSATSKHRLPWGTLVVNTTGALAIGVVAGIIVSGASSGGSLSGAALHAESWQVALALGFLSGYTTFSTASHQTVSLARSGRWGAALLNGIGQLIVTVLFVALGWSIMAVILA